MKQSQEILQELREEGVLITQTVKGKGNKALLVFPGMGMTSTLFESRLKQYESNYVVFYFSMECDEMMDPDFFLKTWNSFLSCLAKEYRLTEWNAMAYSIGCRWLFYSEIQFTKVVLIAPDGISTHWIYRLVTQFIVFEWLFKVFSLVGIQIFKRNVKRFELTGKQVLNQWKLLNCKMFPQLKSLNKTIFLGQKDRLIVAKNIKQKMDFKDLDDVFEMNCNHFELLHGVLSHSRSFF